MKRIVLVVVAVLFALPAFAQLQQGQHMLGVRGGLGFQLQNSGISYSAHDERIDWGTLGSELALSYQYLLTNHLGVGGEISFGDFDGGDFTFNHSDKLEDKVNLINLMLAARYTFHPAKRTRFYIPFGAGLTIAKQTLDIDYLGNDYTKKKTDNSFGWFAGLGLEFDVGNHGWSWGLEARYAAFWYDTDKLVQGAPGPIHGDGNRRYEYMMFSVNVSKRF